jgi:hypothetical protein
MAAVQTLSQAVYDQKVAYAIKNQPIRKTIPLGSLNVLNTGAINVDGKVIPMSKDAFKQLARILGVPVQFQDRVDKFFGEEANRSLVNKMKSALIKQGMSTITLVASPTTKQIVGFLRKENEYISNGSFFEMASNVLNDHSLLVRDFSIDSDRGGVTINCINPTSNFGLKDLKDEFFQGGITLSNSLDEGLNVSPYINRLVCLNGLIGESFSENFQLKSLYSQHIEEFSKHLRELEKREYIPFAFEERVNKSITTNASYAELEAAAHLIMDASGAKKDEISKWIPILETQNRYEAFGKPTFIMSAEQKKNAKTGTPVWDLVNGLTHFSTHESAFKVSEDHRRSIQKEAGNILAGVYDMENQINSPFN